MYSIRFSLPTKLGPIIHQKHFQLTYFSQPYYLPIFPLCTERKVCSCASKRLQQAVERPSVTTSFFFCNKKLQVLRKDDQRAFKMATSLLPPFFEWHLVTYCAFAILLSKWIVACGQYISWKQIAQLTVDAVSQQNALWHLVQRL